MFSPICNHPLTSDGRARDWADGGEGRGGGDNDKWVDEDWGDEKDVRKQVGENKEP